MLKLPYQIKATVAAAALVFGAGAAQAAVATPAANTFTFNWAYLTGQNSLLDGSGSITVGGFNSNLLTLTISLTNAASIGGLGGERLTVFGFGVEPNATGIGFVDAADGGMVNAVLGQNFPGFKAVEVCATGGNNCAGGGNGGVFAGTSDTFTVTLNGNWGSSVTFDPLAIKYQTGYGSFEFAASTPGGSVPEPASASLAVLGLGLLGAGFGLRRRQQRKA